MHGRNPITEASSPQDSAMVLGGLLLEEPVQRHVPERWPALRLRASRGRRAQAALAGAAAAAVVVALEAAAAAEGALPAVGVTFVGFLFAGMTLGRGSRWNAMLPFADVLCVLLAHALAGALAWCAIEATSVASVSVSASAMVLASLAAMAAATFAGRADAAAPIRVVVLGDRRAAEQLGAELRVASVGDHELVGVIARDAAGADDVRCGVPLLGDVSALRELLGRHAIGLVLIEGRASRDDVFDRLAETCLDLPVRVCELSQFYEDVLGHVPVAEIGSAWFRYIMHPRFRSPDTVAKRALDVTVALLAGLLFAPLIAVCAVMIKLYDGGPVLFRQRRIGSGGQPFTLLKLRTMRSGPAEARWSSADDDRVTPIGRVLRRSHLDEFPQLLNVLRGEMSVVGPRPEQPAFVEHLERALPHYSRRHLIQPGLTGWAQVRCGYAGSDAGSATKLCHDLYYLKHRSFALDLAILAETARTLVADRQFREADRAPLLASAVVVVPVARAPAREPV